MLTSAEAGSGTWERVVTPQPCEVHVQVDIGMLPGLRGVVEELEEEARGMGLL